MGTEEGMLQGVEETREVVLRVHVPNDVVCLSFGCLIMSGVVEVDHLLCEDCDNRLPIQVNFNVLSLHQVLKVHEDRISKKDN